MRTDTDVLIVGAGRVTRATSATGADAARCSDLDALGVRDRAHERDDQ
jgi:hypothetical protein